MNPEKDKQMERFRRSQDEMRGLSNRCPPNIQNWDYVKTVHYKKVMKECEKFIKLKVTNDDKQFIRMDNKLTELKRFYN